MNNLEAVKARLQMMQNRGAPLEIEEWEPTLYDYAFCKQAPTDLDRALAVVSAVLDYKAHHWLIPATNDDEVRARLELVELALAWWEKEVQE